MSIEPHLLLYNSQILGRSGSLEKIILSLLQNGFDLFDFQVGSYPNYEARWAELSDATQRNLQMAYEKNGLSFHVRTKPEGLALLVHLGWNDLVVIGDGKEHALASAVSFQTGSFRSEEGTSFTFSRLYLDFGKLLFSLIQPDFGWIDFTVPGGSTWFNDIDRLAIPHVYWANFFGKVYTIKYGMENLIGSPAWLSEPLDDSGVLVVLSPILGFDDNVEQVKAYFDNITQTV